MTKCVSDRRRHATEDQEEEPDRPVSIDRNGGELLGAVRQDELDKHRPVGRVPERQAIVSTASVTARAKTKPERP
jgi:hypothetical protein